MSKKKEVKCGNRFNSGKLNWWSYPIFMFEPVIKVGHQGAEKYGTFNFMKGQKSSTCWGAAQRHINKFLNPLYSDYDDESGNHHLGHAAWNYLTIIHNTIFRPELDDRDELYDAMDIIPYDQQTDEMKKKYKEFREKLANNEPVTWRDLK